MVALGTLFAIVFGVATGVVAAWRRGTAADKGAIWSGLGFYSMPPQWLGLVVVLYVAGWLGLPTSGVKDPTLGILDDPGAIEVIVDRLEHMILPALTLGLVIFGEYTLIVRSAMLETLGEDYVLTVAREGTLQLGDRVEARVSQRHAPGDHAHRAVTRVHHRRGDHRSSTCCRIRESGS